MNSEITSGIIGIVFLILCIGFLSFLQPASGRDGIHASTHPFLDPGSQAASAAATDLDRIEK